MKVSNCMTNDVQIASPDQTIRDVAQVMARLDAGAMPVGDNDRLVGMITDRDIAIRGIAMDKGPDAKVRDVMSPGPSGRPVARPLRRVAARTSCEFSQTADIE